MAKVQYITQLRAADISKMLAAGNMKQGRGVIIRKADDAYTIEIDPEVIVDIIWCFIREGMVLGGAPYAPCSVRETAKNTRNHVHTDPNQFS